MALRGHVFDKQLFSSDCYALVTDTFLNKNSGIIKGCELTNTASSIYIDNGYFVVKGRPIQEEGGTTIEVEPGNLEGIYCKLVCEIDMSQTNTTTSLNQVSYKILEDTSDYPTLIQEDITDDGTIYQFELAKFRRTLNGIENFVDTRSFLNFASIYDFVKNEIKKIEEGSLFITEEELKTEMLNSGVVVSATEPTGNDRKKVWIQKGKNLIDFKKMTNSSLNESNGTLQNDVTRLVTPFIFLLAGTYAVSCNLSRFAYVTYNKDKTFKSFVTWNTFPNQIVIENDCYIKLEVIKDYNGSENVSITDISYLQLEQGSTATEYEEYVEPKIYVKNDNNVYEEFISKEDTLVKYSTEEQLIGKWHNGNNVYRKTLLIDVSNFNGEQEYFINYSDYGINGNIVVNKYKGLCERMDHVWQVLPCTLEEWHIDIYDFKETQFTIKVSQNQKNMGLKILTLVLEYEHRTW